MEVRTIVDAGPLIGWLNAADQWHEWSVSVLKKVKGPVHTSEIVLGEACWNLGGNTKPVHALLSLVARGADFSIYRRFRSQKIPAIFPTETT